MHIVNLGIVLFARFHEVNQYSREGHGYRVWGSPTRQLARICVEYCFFIGLFPICAASVDKASRVCAMRR